MADSPLTKDQKAVQLAEENAPLQLDAPLPREVQTLAYIPEARRANYARSMAGTFTLRFLTSDDERSLSHYNDEIAAGKIGVLPPGETPELRAERAAENDRRAQAVLDKVNAADAAERERKRQAAYDREHAALKNRFGR